MSNASESPHATDPGPTVVISGDTVEVDHLRITDRTLARLLSAEPEQERADLLRVIVETGVRGVVSMGIGLDLGEVDERVRVSVAGATAEAEQTVRKLLDEARSAMESVLDPDHRQSVIARARAEFGVWRDEFLHHVDPEGVGGHAGRLIERLEGLLGPDGPLEQRLAEALDPEADGSALAALTGLIDRRFAEVRDLMAEERGRRKEAERGTHKGFEYEDRLENDLRQACRPLGGVVERTSTTSGMTGTDALVGDFLVMLPGEHRVVVEAKHTKTIALTGADGILAELDRAMSNRGAAVAICVSRNEAFPLEVGPFGVYGNRILVVDDGEGTLLRVALRWAQLLAASADREAGVIDVAAVTERLERVRHLAQLFKSNRRALTGINGSIEQVKASLDTMRSDLLDLLDDIDRHLHTMRAGTVVSMTRPAAS